MTYNLISNILILFLILSSACSPQNSRNKQEENLKALDIIQKTDFRCETNSSKNCPDNIGLVISIFNDAHGRCTGFLISSKRVVTNSHCIPDEVKKDPSLCSSKIAYSYYSNNKRYNLGCKKLIDFSNNKSSDYKAETNDYASFEIEDTKIQAFETSKDIITDNQLITSISIVKNQKKQLKFEKKICKSILYYDYFDEPNTSYAKYFRSSCKIKGGESGSPVLNHKNELIGINTSSYLNVNKNLKKNDIHIQTRLNTDLLDNDTEISLHHNVKCINTDWNKNYDDKLCNKFEKYVLYCNNKEFPINIEHLNQQMKDTRYKFDSKFKYVFTFAVDAVRITPICYNDEFINNNNTNYMEINLPNYIFFNMSDLLDHELKYKSDAKIYLGEATYTNFQFNKIGSNWYIQNSKIPVVNKIETNMLLPKCSFKERMMQDKLMTIIFNEWNDNGLPKAYINAQSFLDLSHYIATENERHNVCKKNYFR